MRPSMVILRTVPLNHTICLCSVSRDRKAYRNPPFYSSKEDMEASYENKKEPPSAANMASENEAICPGGDVGFVTRIFRESLMLREKVHVKCFKPQRGSAHFELDLMPVERVRLRRSKDCGARNEKADFQPNVS